MRDSALFPLLTVEDERRIEREVLEPSPSHVTDDRLTEIIMSGIGTRTRSTVNDAADFTRRMVAELGSARTVENETYASVIAL